MQPLEIREPSPLLDYLFRKFKDWKRTKVKQLLKFGSVRVNGEVVTSHAHPLKPGDRVDFLGKKEAAAERSKKFLKLDIVYEDADIIVVNKPAGLLTIATEQEKQRTLYYTLTEYLGRVYVVHRLDRDTSGLVVFAKTAKAKVALQKNWYKAVKKYQAVVEGRPERDAQEIRVALAEDKFRRVYASKGKDAKDSTTLYKVLQSNGRYSLLELKLETGRKNQIRVHLSGIGHPIAGDEKYGAQSDPLGRMALHACYLSFPHPATEKMLGFESKSPDTFSRLCK